MGQIIAEKIDAELDDNGLPYSPAWEKTQPVSFCSDWCGEHPDPERETQVRILWSPEHLFIQFRCRYRDIFVYDGGTTRRDKLWERDVAEIFIRPGSEDPWRYKEFEISPNGDWLDLDINQEEKTKTILYCALRSRVVVNPKAGVWTAEMAIPFESLTRSFNHDEIWKLNLFRIEGSEPNRFYSAWHPTNTPSPNFHVPESFGELRFNAGFIK
jgi:hypothetical protein